MVGRKQSRSDEINATWHAITVSSVLVRPVVDGQDG
jgi:hypothetical protein